MASKSLLYLAIGDSLTVGIGSLVYADFVKTYSKLTEQQFHTKVTQKKVAKNGLTTWQLYPVITHPAYIPLIRSATIITLTIGGNDLIKAWKYYLQHNESSVLSATLYHAKRNVRDIVAYIQTIKEQDNSPYLIRVVNLYNPTELPRSSKVIQSYNQFLNTLENEHVQVADIYNGFLGKEKQLLSIDGLHPNRNGHKVIAETLDQLGYF